MCGHSQKKEKPSHIVSARSKEEGFCLGQKAVEEKSNEIIVIPELLEKLWIKGQIVTIDAMGTQNDEQGGKRPLEYRKYALAFRCNV